MKLHSRILSLLTVVLVSTLVLAACSDDDDGTGPGDNGPAIKMTLIKGDQFDYNVWALDENNAKIGDPDMHRITYLDNNDVYISGFNDYVFLKEEVNGTKVSDDVAMRASAQGDLYIYNFQHDLYTYFFEFIKQLDPEVDITIPYQNWDLVADFNDDNGNANAKGHTWDISDPDMEPFNFNVDVGLPAKIAVSVLPEIKGVYDGVVESMTIKNDPVTRWQIRLLITMKLRSAVLDQDITFNQTLTFSDNPAGQITMLRETAVLSALGETYTLPGEQRELYTYIKF